MTTTGEAWKIDAFVDGELDLAGQLEIEQRIERDEALRQRIEAVRALRETVREKADRHAAPAGLQERMTAMLAAARREAAAPAAVAEASPAKAAPAGWVQVLERWLAWRPLVASTAFVGLLAVSLNLAVLQSSKQDRLMEEAVASHVRSTVGEHLVDVASSDHHTVKPFLSQRLGFSPPVRELQLPGSVFVGGRVDYLGGRPVAALVYRQGEHVVNSFVWPDTGGSDSAPEFALDRGFRIAHWSQGGMRHCVISDVNREEFRRLVDSVRRAAATG
jgi:anti-sigma factor RsiW